MSRQLVVASSIRIASVAAAFMICPLVAQAASVQTVFSAENALYGAGYSIGKADGWIDDRLRAAIRQYQSGHSDLGVSGELDAPTLAALGISGGRSQLLGGNQVANPDTARRELGLMVITAPEPASAPAPAAQPKPAAEPEPAPRPRTVAAPEPQPLPVAKPEPAKTPEPVQKPKPKMVAETLSKPEPKPAPEPVRTQAEPEPTSEPIKIVSRVREATPNDVTQNDAMQNDAVQNKVTAAPTTLPAEKPAPVDDTRSDESRGNLLTRMFDFLFGWMV